MNWVDAAKGKTAATCPFEYASKLTEIMLSAWSVEGEEDPATPPNERVIRAREFLDCRLATDACARRLLVRPSRDSLDQHDLGQLRGVLERTRGRVLPFAASTQFIS